MPSGSCSGTTSSRSIRQWALTCVHLRGFTSLLREKTSSLNLANKGKSINKDDNRLKTNRFHGYKNCSSKESLPILKLGSHTRIPDHVHEAIYKALTLPDEIFSKEKLEKTDERAKDIYLEDTQHRTINFRENHTITSTDIDTEELAPDDRLNDNSRSSFLLKTSDDESQVYRDRMKALSKVNNIPHMLLLLEQMKSKNLSIEYHDVYTIFASILKKQALQSAVKLYKMLPTIGLRPDETCYSYVVRALIAGKEIKEAYRMYVHLHTHRVSLDSIAYEELIFALVRTKNARKAWEVFEDIRKVIASPSLYSTMIDICSQSKETERAFKLYREMADSSIQLTEKVYQSLIYACATRKDFYMECFSLVKQMEGAGYKPTINVYNSLLLACAKVSDIKTGHIIWVKLIHESEDSLLAPNPYTFSCMFWLLASIETKNNRKSNNKGFFYDIRSIDVIEEAESIFELLIKRHMRINESILISYLSIFTNHLQKEKAETLFYKGFTKYSVLLKPISYQHMFEMYDTLHDYDSTLKLKVMAKENMIELSRRAWRAIVRTTAWVGNVVEAVRYAQEMRDAGNIPTREELKLVTFRCSEIEDWESLEGLRNICEVPMNHKSKYELWNERTKRVNELLDKVYGKPAGKGYLRNVYDNMKGPGATFSDSNRDDEEFEKIDSQFPSIKIMRKVGRKKLAKTKKKRIYAKNKPQRRRIYRKSK